VLQNVTATAGSIMTIQELVQAVATTRPSESGPIMRYTIPVA
jgi:hypothetical protein